MFYRNGNPQELLAEMVEHLESISAAAEANLMEVPEMETLFEFIEQKLEEQEEEEETEEEEEEEDDDDDDDDDEGTPPKKKLVPPLFKLKAKLKRDIWPSFLSLGLTLANMTSMP